MASNDLDPDQFLEAQCLTSASQISVRSTSAGRCARRRQCSELDCPLLPGQPEHPHKRVERDAEIAEVLRRPEHRIVVDTDRAIDQ